MCVMRPTNCQRWYDVVAGGNSFYIDEIQRVVRADQHTVYETTLTVDPFEGRRRSVVHCKAASIRYSSIMRAAICCGTRTVKQSDKIVRCVLRHAASVVTQWRNMLRYVRPLQSSLAAAFTTDYRRSRRRREKRTRRWLQLPWTDRSENSQVTTDGTGRIDRVNS